MFANHHSAQASQQIYKLRYQAYLDNESIRPNRDEMLMDAYDEADNCYSHIEYVDGVPAGSIRAMVYEPNRPDLALPAAEVFGEEVGRYTDAGYRIVESSKFVVHPDFQHKLFRLKLALFKHVFEVAKDVDADYIFTETRPEHARFYRSMHFEPISDVRQAKTLNFQIQLLACPIRSLRSLAASDMALAGAFARFGLSL